MIQRALSIFLTAMVLWVGSACTRMPKAEGYVTLSFSTGQLQTRAEADGNVADGGGIRIDSGTPDLKVFIFDAGGNLAASYNTGNTAKDKFTLSETSAASVSVRAAPDQLAAGTYSVYALANTGVNAGSGSNLSFSSTDWANIATKSALDALLLTMSSGTPVMGDRMPLSAVGSLSVNASGNGQVSLELLRCVAKVVVSFKNQTEDPLTLEECTITLHEMNPDKGYVFSSGDVTVPGSAALNNLVLTADALEGIPVGETGSVPAKYVFPSVAPVVPGGTESRYTCDIQFRVGGVSKDFSGLPVHDNISRDIPSLKRNQYLKIEIRVSNTGNVSFNFVVADWKEKTENVTFS